MRVGIDLDGVNIDFSRVFGDWLVESGICPTLTKHLSNEPVYIDEKDVGCTSEELIDILNRGVDEGKLFVGPPMVGAVEAAWKIREMGHTIHIITDRRFGTDPKKSQELTFAWLEKVNYPYDTIDFSRDKTCRPTDIFIDDLVRNYEALEAAGTPCYLVNRVWNQPHNDGRRRVCSMTEFASIIENITYLSRII